MVTAPVRRRRRNAPKELYDDYDAVGVISLFSSLGRAIIGVTNQSEYDFVQCNVSASNPYLNDSASNTAEEPTDTAGQFLSNCSIGLPTGWRNGEYCPNGRVD